MSAITIYQIDSFTREKFKGNPAGVVLNAKDLTESLMQQIARELNNSETAFVFPSAENDYDAEVRYFTPRTEVPVCGHATIAALYAMAVENKLKACTIRIKTKVGILPIEIIPENDDYQIVMIQGKFELLPPFDASTISNIIKALGLTSTDLNPACPIQIASTGHSKVMIGINSRRTLNRLAPNMHELAQISKTIACNGYFVFTFDSDNESILTHGRMFAPAIGIEEDPVTGNANGPLGGYLVENNLVPFSDKFEFWGAQGEAINRQGMMLVTVDVKDGKPSVIRIKGEAVIVFKAEMEV